PILSPTRAAASRGTERQRAPSSSTSTRPPRSRSAVTRATAGLCLRFGFGPFGLLVLRGGGRRRRSAVRGGGRAVRRRQEARRGHLVVAELALDPGEDLLRHVGMLAQERRRVLA